MTITGEQATIITGVVIAIITAITGSAIKIIKAVRTTGRAISSEQTVSKARGKARDRKIHDIHVLVNSRLTVALKLLVSLTKKEAERTHDPADIKAYEQALEELNKADEATRLVEEGLDVEAEMADEIVVAQVLADAAKVKAKLELH